MSAGTDSAVEGSAISLPKGGAAVGGLGEKFSPDLFTGTGNFSVPIAIPAGRLGVEPQVSLGYSTGSGDGPFGLGWQLSLRAVSRKTSRGVPWYVDAAGPGTDGPRADVFVLSGAEDLVPVEGSHPGRVRYRLRTEGLPYTFSLAGEAPVAVRCSLAAPDGVTTWRFGRSESEISGTAAAFCSMAPPLSASSGPMHSWNYCANR